MLEEACEGRAELRAVLAQENWQELPDLSDQCLVLLGLDLAKVLPVLPEANGALRLERFDERKELADEEDQISLLELLASDVQQVRSGVLRIGQTVQVEVCHAQGQLDEELGRPHHLHERPDAVLPGIVSVAGHLKLRDD